FGCRRRGCRGGGVVRRLTTRCRGGQHGIPAYFSRRTPMTRRSGGARRSSRASTRRRGGGGSPRFTVVRIVLVLVLVIAGVKLVWIQGFASDELAGYAEQQRSKVIPVNAPRGTIVARDGQKLAVSTEKRALMVSLQAMRQAISEETSKHPDRSEERRVGQECTTQGRPWQGR